MEQFDWCYVRGWTAPDWDPESTKPDVVALYEVLESDEWRLWAKEVFQLWTDRTFLQFLSEVSRSEEGTRKQAAKVGAGETEDGNGTVECRMRGTAHERKR